RFRWSARAFGWPAAIRDLPHRHHCSAPTRTISWPSSAIQRARSTISRGRRSHETDAAAYGSDRFGTGVMSTNQPQKTPEEWWSTSIIDMKPGSIRIRGYAIEELIGSIGFEEMVFLMTRGELPQPGAAMMLYAALVAADDH